MYGSEIWGFYKSDDVEKVHIRFLKQILGVRSCVLGTGKIPSCSLKKNQDLEILV